MKKMKTFAVVAVCAVLAGDCVYPVFADRDAQAQVQSAATVTANTVTALVGYLKDPNFHGTILIPDGPDFNLDGYKDLPLRDGVVLKGTRMKTTPGRLLYTNDSSAKHDLFRIAGSNVRVEGLRFRGPYSGTSADVNAVTAFRIVTAEQPTANVKLKYSNIVITNNELWAWPGSAISVEGMLNYADCFNQLPLPEQTTRPWHAMRKTDAGFITITRNYIHHNQRQNLGYGVVLGSGAYALIQGNVFDYNRHAVAHNGDPYTGYIARDNYNLQGAEFMGTWPIGYWPTHYDVHGCGEGGDGGDAGEYIEVAYNTIRGEQAHTFELGVRIAFHVRGTPRDAARFIENTVVHDDFDEATAGPVERIGGTFDAETSEDLAAGDFDGDGHDDVLIATGSGFYYSSWGQAPWQWLARSSHRLKDIRIGDFDGDGYADIFTKEGSTWRYFSTGEGVWKSDLATSTVPLEQLGFGDFDGNGITDVFYADGTNWFVSWDARSAWTKVNSSQYTVANFRFGDFDGDGATDVFMIGDGVWRYSSGAQSLWIKLRDAPEAKLGAIRLGDFDGDGYTDVAYETTTEWRFSPRGTGATVRLRDSHADANTSLQKGVLGKFSWGPHAARDVFIRFSEAPYEPNINPYRFVFWYNFPGTGQAFALQTPQNMR